MLRVQHVTHWSAITLATITLAVTTLAETAPAYAFNSKVYHHKNLTFTSIQALKNGQLQIEFSSMPETLYYCPGANAKTTKQGIELTFVRSPIKSKPKVTHPAKRAANKKGMSMSVLVKHMNKTVFLRDGKKLLQLYPKKK